MNEERLCCSLFAAIPSVLVPSIAPSLLPPHFERRAFRLRRWSFFLVFAAALQTWRDRCHQSKSDRVGSCLSSTPYFLTFNGREAVVWRRVAACCAKRCRRCSASSPPQALVERYRFLRVRLERSQTSTRGVIEQWDGR